MNRREFIQYLIKISVGLPILTIIPWFSSLGYKSMEVKRIWPVVVICSLNELKEKGYKVFMYPLTNTPNILIKVGEPVKFGIGPENDIVAYSLLCQHLGCVVRYLSSLETKGSVSIKSDLRGKPLFYCPCHAGVYDIIDGGVPVAGPPKFPLPRVLLRIENINGNDVIIAYGMTPPVIYGKGPLGSADIEKDLYGGDLVG
jgi:arsenite oxidase small subunit